MRDSIDHSLVKPNYLRHYGNKVQDNLMSAEPLQIITYYNEFCMYIAMEVTIMCDKTRSPTYNELQTFPHIILSSPHNWNPNAVWFQ